MKYTIEIANNTKDPKILTDIIKEGKDDNVSCYTASNPNCPPETLKEVLQRGKNDGVSRNAARNPNCPKEVLKEVLQRGKDDDVSLYAAQNPNCPPEALTLVLQRGKDDGVSIYAASNPNCPLPSLHQWLITTNNIDSPHFSKQSSKVKEYSQKSHSSTGTTMKTMKIGLKNKYKTKDGKEIISILHLITYQNQNFFMGYYDHHKHSIPNATNEEEYTSAIWNEKGTCLDLLVNITYPSDPDNKVDQYFNLINDPHKKTYSQLNLVKLVSTIKTASKSQTPKIPKKSLNISKGKWRTKNGAIVNIIPITKAEQSKYITLTGITFFWKSPNSELYWNCYGKCHSTLNYFHKSSHYNLVEKIPEKSNKKPKKITLKLNISEISEISEGTWMTKGGTIVDIAPYLLHNGKSTIWKNVLSYKIVNTESDSYYSEGLYWNNSGKCFSYLKNLTDTDHKLKVPRSQYDLDYKYVPNSPKTKVAKTIKVTNSILTLQLLDDNA